MTPPDDGPRDDPPKGTPDGPVEPELPFDEEAAWLSIVENYGERPQLGSSSVEPQPQPQAKPEPDPPAAIEHRRAEDRHAEEHFVPPEPPPIPRGTPARRLAWAGLFVPPLLMILAVAVGWTFPTWLSFLLVAGFVGGFVFLVATMPRDGGDGWDDGAVV